MGSATKKSDSKVLPVQGDPEVTAQTAQELGLTEAEFDRLVRELGKKPNHAELCVAATLWSERIANKSSRMHLKRLPTTGPHVSESVGENAGCLDLGDGASVVVKLEVQPLSNRGTPSDVAANSLSAVVREVLALGARPVATLQALRFGGQDAARTREIVRSVVSSLSAYGHRLGVPNIGGDTQIDARSDAETHVGALAIGVVRTDALIPGKASGLGNKVVLVGGRTSRYGATNADLAAKVIEACLALFESGNVEGAEDVDAGGLAAAAVEMAARAGTGLELDLDAISRAEAGLRAGELVCAESAERILIVARKGREEAVLRACRELDVEAAVVGTVTNTQRFCCKATAGFDPAAEGASASGKQALVVDLPIALLTTDAPRYERAIKAVAPDTTMPELPTGRALDVERELLRLVGSPRAGSREWIYKQLEQGSKASTLVRPGQGDAAVIKVTAGSDEQIVEKHLAVSLDASLRHTELDPRQGAAMLVAECARNVVCGGAEPLGVVHALTFSHPDEPETMWRVSQIVDGIRDACVALKLPVVGGDLSAGMEPTARPSAVPTVAVVGQLRDPAERLQLGFSRQADMIALLGASGSGNLAGSDWLASRGNKIVGTPLQIDLAAEVKLQRALLELARDRMLSSAHDVSDGGLGVCLAESCIAGRIGCSVELPGDAALPQLARLFHEEPSRVVVSFKPEQREKVQKSCEALGVPFLLLGFVGGDTLEIEDVMDVPVHVLADTHARALEPVVG